MLQKFHLFIYPVFQAEIKFTAKMNEYKLIHVSFLEKFLTKGRKKAKGSKYV